MRSQDKICTLINTQEIQCENKTITQNGDKKLSNWPLIQPRIQ